MPVNFQSIQAQIRQMGLQSQNRENDLNQKLDLAQRLLEEWAVELEAARTRVDQVAALNDNLRCAVPTSESLTTRSSVPPLKCDYVLLAADGSQIIPSHHDAVEFGVINVGAVRMVPGQPLVPAEKIESRLLYYESLYNSQGNLITEEVIALMRDIEERGMLATLAERETLPVVTLTDGQLELYGESKSSKEFEQKLDLYIQVLYSLARQHVVTAGYVSKPGSDLVVRLLDILQLNERELDQADSRRKLRGLRDVKLFEQILGPGQRSAVFSIHSRMQRFEGPLEVHFFYLNASEVEKRPHIARVEIPAWVAEDESLVDLLQWSLACQCRQMGSKPYPYILHRAHEVAVVSLEEKKQLEMMIQVELRRQGVQVEETSDKQSLKDISGSRTRF